ncbi:GNAT family N-acetyltransferase [Butyrivibrio sp. VCB2006]|uniref:GNAT family N-acetyltransferase n=1 Tax=Butyrivibrio sp. VCB2006 TaxID=1280679 RepID=UPI0003FDC385|nr:GNAT family N-acetyltransferase [Butyrivibrio sp. VCB2006]
MQLRRATMDDALDVLVWRNDETTRQNSFTQDLISQEDHLKWFKRKLEDENCIMYILEDGTSVGSIRLDVTDNIGEISYMIAPDKRGKGYGKKILKLVEQTSEAGEIKSLVGFVNESNPASAKCFESNGYVKLIANNIYCYIKTR